MRRTFILASVLGCASAACKGGDEGKGADTTAKQQATASSTGSTATASATATAAAVHPEPRPPFDAGRLRTGRFVYRTVLGGNDVGRSTISITRVDARTYLFRNEVTGQFRQTWESTATPSFAPLSATLGLGANDDKSISMNLVYEGGSVTGTATKRDPVDGLHTNAVSAHVPPDVVDQRIDWAAMAAAPLTRDGAISFTVYDPWTGLSRVSARMGATDQLRVPAGTFAAGRVVYRIEKSQGVEQYEVWVSESSPHFMVREDFPNGAISELVQLME